MSELAWYWGRKAFKRNPVLLDAVRSLDAELKWRSEQSPDFYGEREEIYTFPRTDYGRVTWDMTYGKYKALAPIYVPSDRFPDRPPVKEGLLVAASNLIVPTIAEDAIPRHIANGIDIPSIDEIDDGEDEIRTHEGVAPLRP